MTSDRTESRLGAGVNRLTNVQPHWYEAVKASVLVDAATRDGALPTAILVAVFGDRRTGLDLLGIHPDMAADFRPGAAARRGPRARKTAGGEVVRVRARHHGRQAARTT